MTKAEIVTLIADEADITKKSAVAVLDAFVRAIHDSLKTTDGRIRISELGTFSVSKRKARAGVNPRTLKKMKIPAMKVPRFTPSKALKETATKAK